MIKKILIAILGLLSLFAIKSRYGGEVSIRLNEPASFAPNTSTYSNLIFYSLIYENFFYLGTDGKIGSNIFKDYGYDGKTKTLTLELKENLSFSDGSPMTGKGIQSSLKIFLSLNLDQSFKLNQMVKAIGGERQTVVVEFLQDIPDIVSLLTAPDLVVIADNDHAFSGPFYPVDWKKNEWLVLRANPFYPGGRTYLDAVRVVFSEGSLPDVFLSDPSQKLNNFREFDAGIYQNFYLCFPQAGVGLNTRLALHALLKKFNSASGTGLRDLSSLTSDEESPVSIRIKAIPGHQIKSLLRYADIKLYAFSSLSHLERDFAAYLVQNKYKIDVLFVDDNQLKNFINDASVQYILINKTFQKKTPIEEKIVRIVKELSFNQFNEKYLRMLNELEEVKNIASNEMLMEQIAKINETLINDGFVLPLFQKVYSLYIKNSLQGVTVDYFGRPLLQRGMLGHD